MNTDVKELEVMEDIASLAAVTGEKKRKIICSGSWKLAWHMQKANRLDSIFFGWNQV